MLTLKIKPSEGKIETIKALTMALTNVGLEYIDEKTGGTFVYEYNRMDSWEAKAVVSEKQKASKPKTARIGEV